MDSQTKIRAVIGTEGCSSASCDLIASIRDVVDEIHIVVSGDPIESPANDVVLHLENHHPAGIFQAIDGFDGVVLTFQDAFRYPPAYVERMVTAACTHDSVYGLGGVLLHRDPKYVEGASYMSPLESCIEITPVHILEEVALCFHTRTLDLNLKQFKPGLSPVLQFAVIANEKGVGFNILDGLKLVSSSKIKMPGWLSVSAMEQVDQCPWLLHDLPLHVKVCGERGTGTNLVEQTITREFVADVCGYGYLGWKHRLANNLEQGICNGTIFVVMVRHPLRWLLSLYQKPFHLEELSVLTFSEFIREPVADPFDSDRVFRHVIDMWNVKYRAWLNLLRRNDGMLIKLEDLHRDPRDVFHKFGNAFNLTRRHDEFQPIEDYLNPMGEEIHKKKPSRNASIGDFEVDPEDMAFIRNAVDAELVEQMGYGSVLESPCSKASKRWNQARRELIFVQIPAYRDPELVPTLDDMIEKAAYPDRLRIAVCWQDEDPECIQKHMQDPRFTFITMHWSQARGVCWARNLLNRLYRGEPYFLQLDSHHRFASGWDAQLVEIHTQLGGGKILISEYPPGYDYGADGQIQLEETVSRSVFSGHRTLEGIPILRGKKTEVTSVPSPAHFLSAGFIFGPGLFCEEVPYDPYHYFQGEEIALSLRAFTYGYDFFHALRPLVWHLYGCRNIPHHHVDHVQLASELNRKAAHRMRQLFRIHDHGIDLGIYGLGNERGIEDYQEYTGLIFELFPPRYPMFNRGIVVEEKVNRVILKPSDPDMGTIGEYVLTREIYEIIREFNGKRSADSLLQSIEEEYGYRLDPELIMGLAHVGIICDRQN
jgi:hypothetical protein